MKKAIFTLSFVALFALASNAQDSKTKKQTTKAAQTETVNPDGTVSFPTNSAGQPTEANSVKKEETTKKEASPVKKKGTRMAINEKGLPGNQAPKKDSKTAPATETSSGKK